MEGKWLEWQQLHFHWYMTRPCRSKWILFSARRLDLGYFKRICSTYILLEWEEPRRKSLHGVMLERRKQKDLESQLEKINQYQLSKWPLFFYLSSHLHPVTWKSHINIVITGEEVRARAWKEQVTSTFFLTVRKITTCPGGREGVKQEERSGKTFIGYEIEVLIDFVPL